MAFSPHGLRVEEKKLYRKLFFTVLAIIGSFLIVIFVGLPILAKIVVTFSTRDMENVTATPAASSLLFAPILDPLVESTNSATLKIAGFAEKETKVVILVNNKEQKKVAADKDGRFIADKIQLAEGENIISAKLIKDSQESTSSSPLAVTYKKNPPKLEIEKPAQGEKFFSENKDITIVGSTDPGSKVSINDRLVIVDYSGKFSYPVTLSDGENMFTITAQDGAGNQTTVERKVTYNP